MSEHLGDTSHQGIPGAVLLPLLPVPADQGGPQRQVSEHLGDTSHQGIREDLSDR